MGRIESIRKHITKDMQGLEIAPYHNPICRKSEGYNVKILDVFDTERLHENAKNDPLVLSTQLIEPVDYVGSACDLRNIIKDTKFDYVVSSHNFEHLPNPVKFLQAVQTLLEDDGVLSMAIPDYRYVFDVHKFPTRIHEFIRWYHTDRTYNDPFDVFHYQYQHIEQHYPQAKVVPKRIVPISKTHKEMLGRFNTPKEYVDVHVSYFTPTSFRLLMYELNEMGYINMEINDMEVGSFEFIVHLRKTNHRFHLDEKERSDFHFDIIEEMYDVMRFRS